MKRKIYKEDILEAGLELMFDFGYNATGIKEITNKIDIPKGSFYNHFSNKEEFGLEVVDYYCKRGVEMHRKRLTNKSLKPLERLKIMYNNIIQNYKENLQCKKGCIMSNFSAEMSDINESFRTLLDKYFNEIEDMIIAVLEEAQLLGEISSNIDTKVTGAFILNSWHGALIRMKTTANIKPLEDFKNLIFNQTLK